MQTLAVSMKYVLLHLGAPTILKLSLTEAGVVDADTAAVGKLPKESCVLN